MKAKGCLFEIKTGKETHYYLSHSVFSLEDFMAYFIKGLDAVPDKKELTAVQWRRLADMPQEAEQYTSLFLDEGSELLFVYEDRGGGAGYYVFPLGAVIMGAVEGGSGLWERLLTYFPKARRDQ